MLITGLRHVGKAGFSLARELSVNTLAALILYLSLIVMCGKLTEGHARHRRHEVTTRQSRLTENRNRGAEGEKRAAALVSG